MKIPESLPWHIEEDFHTVVMSDGTPSYCDMDGDDLAYAVHAANLYPKMLEELKGLLQVAFDGPPEAVQKYTEWKALREAQARSVIMMPRQHSPLLQGEALEADSATTTELHSCLLCRFSLHAWQTTERQ